tara:strand:+ start:419 stop:772 length:354 start_codon:yes stop_codon:yes gene_type:complete
MLSIAKNNNNKTEKTMIKVANKDARALVEDKNEFKGNNIFSEYKEDCYIVYSYGYHFPMFVYDLEMCQWYENSDKYSSSTSKQQTQCRPRVDDIIPLGTHQLKDLVEHRIYPEGVNF